MESTNEIVIMIVLGVTFFATLVLVIFILAKYSYLTKKVLAETGRKTGSMSNKFIYQDIACIVIGLGFGLGFSSIISVLNLSEDTMDLLIYGTISIFTGVGLLLAHILRKRSIDQ